MSAAVGRYEPYNTNEEYDPVTNTWDLKRPMPTSRCLFAIGVVNNRVYAIGGSSTDLVKATDTNVHEEYDPTSDSWIDRTPMPTPRRGLGVGVLGDQIYAIGGGTGNAHFGWYDNYPDLYYTKNEQYTTPQIALIVSIATNQTTVNSGANISVQVNVTNGTSVVKDASVQLLSDKGGTFTPELGNTDSNGGFNAIFTAPNVTMQTDLRVTAHAIKTGYLRGQGQKQIIVNHSPPDGKFWLYIAVIIIVVFTIGSGIAISRRKKLKPKEERTLTS